MVSQWGAITSRPRIRPTLTCIVTLALRTIIIFTSRLVVSIIRGSIFILIISLLTPSDGTSDEICRTGRIVEVCNARPSLKRTVRDPKVPHPQSISFPG